MKSTTRPRVPKHNALSLAATALLMGMSLPALAGYACTMDDGTSAGSSASGEYSAACGFANNSFTSLVSDGAGSRSSAFGVGNDSPGNNSSAFGFNSLSRGENSLAFGSWYDVNQDGTTGIDAFLFVLPDLDIDGDGTPDSYSELTTAWGRSSVAIGAASRAVGDFSSVVGFRNIANGVGSSALGSTNTANSQGSSAIGASNTATGLDSSAFGSTNIALGDNDAAIGTSNNTGVTDFFSLSGNNAALGVGNTATGGFAAFIGSPRYSSAAVGAGNQATGGNSSALGVDNLASAINSTAIGYSSVASADDSTAIGSNSVADRVNTLSVGAVGSERQIVNVADATEVTDAVNLGQLVQVGNTLATGVATVLGGGAAWNPLTGTFTAPTYVIQSNNYGNVGAAFAAVDGALDDLDTRIGNAGGIQGEQGDSAYEVAVNNGFAGSESDWLDSLQGEAGPAGPTGPEGPAGGGPESVQYDDSSHAQLTLTGANGTRISNVANAVAAGDAVNLGQMQAGDAATLSSAQDYADAGDAETLASANTYTDNTATETLTSANAYTDQRFAEITGLSDTFENFRNETDRRFQQQDRRIDKLSAMSGAYAGMAMNTSGLGGRNRVGVGVGAQGGEQALAVGYQRAVGNRASVSIAGAFSGNEKSVSAGAGFSW